MKIDKEFILDLTIDMLKSGCYSQQEILKDIEYYKGQINETDKQPKKVLQTKPNTKQK